MRVDARAKRLTIFVDATDQWSDRPLHAEIVRRAREAGLAGASVLRGIEGYGASSHIHAGRLLRQTDDLPIAIIIVDAEEAIRAFLPRLDEVVAEGLVIIEDIDTRRHVCVDPDRLLSRRGLLDRLHRTRRASHPSGNP